MIFTLICALVLFGLIFIDQITKALAAAANVRQVLISGLLELNYYENTGMAFSLFSNNASAMRWITAFTVVMIIAIAVMFFTVFSKNKPAQAALAVIEAGAVGNLIDRLCLGYVRDFVDVSAFGFGVCNIADFCVTFGAVALVFIIVFIGKTALLPLTQKWRDLAAADEAAAAAEQEAAAARKRKTGGYGMTVLVGLPRKEETVQSSEELQYVSSPKNDGQPVPPQAESGATGAEGARTDDAESAKTDARDSSPRRGDE